MVWYMSEHWPKKRTYCSLYMPIIAIVLDRLGASVLGPTREQRLKTVELLNHPESELIVDHVCKMMKEKNIVNTFSKNELSILDNDAHIEWLKLINGKQHEIEYAVQEKVMFLTSSEVLLAAREKMLDYMTKIGKVLIRPCTEWEDEPHQDICGPNELLHLMKTISPAVKSIPTRGFNVADLTDLSAVVSILRYLKQEQVLSEQEYNYCMDPSRKMLVTLASFTRQTLASNAQVAYQIRLCMRYDEEHNRSVQL